MENAPPELLPWLKSHFKGKTARTPDYGRAAADLESKTGFHVEADGLRHVACGYKAPSGLLAAAIETWTRGKVSATDLITWSHYARQRSAA